MERARASPEHRRRRRRRFSTNYATASAKILIEDPFLFTPPLTRPRSPLFLSSLSNRTAILKRREAIHPKSRLKPISTLQYLSTSDCFPPLLAPRSTLSVLGVLNSRDFKVAREIAR